MKEEHLELLKQIQTKTVIWNYEEQILARELVKLGLIEFPRTHSLGEPYLTYKGLKAIGLNNYLERI